MTSDKEDESANLGDVEPRHPGAMTAYLRQAVLEEAEATALLESYEAALGRLREDDRQAIVALVELNLPYREVPAILGKPTKEAAHPVTIPGCF